MTVSNTSYPPSSPTHGTCQLCGQIIAIGVVHYCPPYNPAPYYPPVPPIDWSPHIMTALMDLTATLHKLTAQLAKLELNDEEPHE